MEAVSGGWGWGGLKSCWCVCAGKQGGELGLPPAVLCFCCRLCWNETRSEEGPAPCAKRSGAQERVVSGQKYLNRFSVQCFY